MQQSEIGLANSLLGIGTGSQNSYWEALSSVPNPVYLLTGEYDAKFVAIAREMAAISPSWQHTSCSRGRACNSRGKTAFVCYNDYGVLAGTTILEEEENDSSMGNNPYI